MATFAERKKKAFEEQGAWEAEQRRHRGPLPEDDYTKNWWRDVKEHQTAHEQRQPPDPPASAPTHYVDLEEDAPPYVRKLSFAIDLASHPCFMFHVSCFGWFSSRCCPILLLFVFVSECFSLARILPRGDRTGEAC
jgi:hypothetical protein